MQEQRERSERFIGFHPVASCTKNSLANSVAKTRSGDREATRYYLPSALMERQGSVDKERETKFT